MTTKKAHPVRKAPGVSQRAVALLERMALEANHPDQRAGLLHLSDLYRHCPTFYPNVNIPESDGLPLKGSRASTAGFSSPGAMCMEG